MKDFNGGAVRFSVHFRKRKDYSNEHQEEVRPQEKKNKNLLILSEAVNAKGMKENSKDKVRERIQMIFLRYS